MIGSQAMMIISPVLGYRNLLSGLLMFSVIIVIIEVNLKINKKSLNLTTVLLILLAVTNNFDTAKGYYQTRIIDTENIAVIDENNENEVITLKKFKDDTYGWSMPYLSPFHEVKFKEFYEIRGDIVWK